MEDIELEKRIGEMKIEYGIGEFGLWEADAKIVEMLIREATLFGHQHMKQKAINSVPEKIDYISDREGPIYYQDKLAEKFNDCREQTLSALGKL